MRIYLDWNATAPLLPEVRGAMVRAMDEVHGNASSIHQEGQAARAMVERARRALARSLGVGAQAVVLTSGATEANNQVLRMHARYHRAPDGRAPHVVCSAVEHPSVVEVVEALGESGVRTGVIGVDREGRIDMASLEEALERGATLVSVMAANNELGNVYPTAEIAAQVHAHGALCHVDATQAWGRVALSFEESGADVMTLSAHKMGGPKGIGAIIAREGVVIEAMLSGGHQERGRRPGTENVIAAAGLEAAAQAVMTQREVWSEQMERKRSRLLDGLRARLDGVQLRGDQRHRLPNTLNLAFDAVSGEDALLSFDLSGVSASSGSACTAGSIEPSHVVLAMGYDAGEAKRSVRLSVGPMTSDEAIDEAIERMSRDIERLRMRSARRSV